MKCIVIGTAVGMLACALPAFGQASYEIGYTFNDEPEIVRVEPEPFQLVAINPNPPDYVVGQALGMYFPFDYSGPGLTACDIQQQLRQDSPRDALIAGRARVAFTDLVFSGPGSGTISVDIRLFYTNSQVLIPYGEANVGMEYEGIVRVVVASQEFEGRSHLVIADGSGGSSRIRSGFLDDLPMDRVVTITDIEVPLNEPVTIQLETINTALRPAGTTGFQMRVFSELPETGFPIDRDVFVVPDGVRVDSLQARIEDNRWRFCQADLDHDGELTLFDFLEFSRLFDAGDARADFDGDGELTVFDFLAFQNRFDAGCRFDY